eukprot:399435-Amphidinium_carterae.1
MTETNSSKGSGRLVRPPPTPCLSLLLRLRKREMQPQKQQGTNPSGKVEWQRKKSWRGRISLAAERWQLLAWRDQVVDFASGASSGKGADSGNPLKGFFSPFLHFCSSCPPWRGRVDPSSPNQADQWLRIGEAKNPGPPTLERPSGGQKLARGNLKVLTVNAGGWAPAMHSLSLNLYDIVFVQETWLMEGSIRSASFQASQQGYEGVFCPARKDKTLGRGKGGLAILSRLGTPMLRATE